MTPVPALVSRTALIATVLLAPALASGKTAPASPSLKALDPATILAGSTAVTLEIDGASFRRGAVARLNGERLATTFVSPTRLAARVPGSRLVSPGTLFITVSQERRLSASLPFVVAAAEGSQDDDDWAQWHRPRETDALDEAATDRGW